MVVMVLFTILIIVVSQLQFSTKLEEELAEVRATESLGTFAIASVASHVIVLLAEDFRESKMAASDTGMTGGMAAAPATPGEGGGAQQPNPTARVRDPGESGSPGAATPGAAGAGGNTDADPGTYDFILKTIFTEDTKTINGVTVKFVIRDNERTFNLNRLWEYPRIIVESLTEEQEMAEDEEAREEAEQENAESADAEALAENIDPQELMDQLQNESGELNRAELEWIPPTDEMREATREMLERAIDLTMSLNEDRGFLYQFDLPRPADLAMAIEDYCFMRRSQEYQNSINLVSELLNLEFMTPELYYGPEVQIPPGEEFIDPLQNFSYTKDEFGDLIGEALYASDDWLYDMEDRRAQLDEFLGMGGREDRYASVPGLGRMGNPLTRNMQEYAEDMDGYGLLVPPKPLGLRDIFCTHSTAKININTASPPVIYGLLLSLVEEDAVKVALDLEEYRFLYQEEISEEELDGDIEGAVDMSTPDLGQPRRQPPPEEDELFDEFGEETMTDTVGLENPETNYFTDLRQLILIDGEEGDADDLLNEGEGVEMIDEDFKTPFQNVRDDLSKVTVYGSTFFTATLKIKTENSPIVKEGYLLLHRDVANRRVEIIQYQELER